MGVTIVREREFADSGPRVPFLGVPCEFVRTGRGRRVVQEVPAHGRHAGDFLDTRPGRAGRMLLLCSSQREGLVRGEERGDGGKVRDECGARV